MLHIIIILSFILYNNILLSGFNIFSMVYKGMLSINRSNQLH